MDFFDRAGCTDDIKYEVLSNLDEMEIHSTISMVDREWNIVCLSTFYHPNFKYKFESYFRKILSRPASYLFGKIYVQCPWDHKWRQGTIVTIVGSFEITVKIEALDYDPFIPNIKLKALQSSVRGSFKCRFSDISLGDFFFEKDKYHHIAPLNTVEKYYKISNYNLIDQLINGNKSNDNSVRFDDFGRNIIEFKNPLTYDNGNLFYLWVWNFDGDSTQRLPYLHSNNSHWDYGIIDIKAFYAEHPDWQETMTKIRDSSALQSENNKTETKETRSEKIDKIFGRLYQIPVLVDITSLVYTSKALEICDGHPPPPRNLFLYGNNRFFIRLWINVDCNKSNLIQFKTFDKESFARSLSLNNKHQQRLLATPAMNKINIDSKNVDFIKNNQLTLKQLQNEYIIYNPQVSELNFSEIVQKYPKNILLYRHIDGKFYKTALVSFESSNNNNNNNNKESTIINSFDILFEGYVAGKTAKLSVTDLAKILMSTVDDNSSYSYYQNFQSIFYRLQPICFRPMINFDIKSLTSQLLSKHASKYPNQIVDDLIQSKQFPQILTKCQPFFVLIKPCNIGVKDFEWKPEWSEERRLDNLTTKKKMLMMKWQNVAVDDNNNSYNSNTLWHECLWNYYQNIDINCEKWKIGVFFIPQFKKGDETQSLLDILCVQSGHYGVYVDITAEFDLFQQTLQREYVKYNGQDSQAKWNNRTYFFVNSNKHIVWNKHSNKIYCKYWVHLDDTAQVIQYF